MELLISWNPLGGFQIERTQEEFIQQVQEIGLSVIGQSDQLVKADKLLYALRDVTATVDTIPLIAGSVMSKKILPPVRMLFFWM